MIKRLRISFEWKTLVASNQPTWPFLPNDEVNSKLLRGANIYRFLFHEHPTQHAYIGEAGVANKRLKQYLAKFQEYDKQENLVKKRQRLALQKPYFYFGEILLFVSRLPLCVQKVRRSSSSCKS